MKVLLISDHYGFGGVATVHYNLAKGLKSMGHTPILVGAFLNRIGRPLPEGVAYEYLTTAAWERKLIVPYVLKLARYLKRHADAGLVISAKEHVNVFVIMAMKLAGIKAILVCNSHSTVSAVAKNMHWRGHGVVLALARLLYPYADVVANVSRGAAQDSEAFFGLKKVHYLPNPVLESLDDTRHPSPYAPGRIDVLACGRLAAVKDYPRMLRAFALALKQEPTLHLTLLGDGEEAEKLKLLAEELGIARAVTFAGFVANPQPYMQHAACLLMTSTYEGFGMVLIEALAQGCPVVAVDCPHGPADIIDGNQYGMIVDGDTPDDIARDLLKQLHSPRKSKAHYQARAMDFDIATCTQKYIELAEI